MSPPVPARSSASTDEAAYLRQLLDRQPACMMRVGADGTMLAVNDAALSLLGADNLAQVLDTALADRLVPEHHDLWRDFAARVWSDGSGSLECDMVDPTGATRSLRLQGIALADHPDGVRSLLINARDLSSTRRLEQALQDQEATGQALEQLRTELAVATSARDQSLAAASESNLAAEALRTELERSLTEQRRMADGIVQRDHDRRKIDAVLKQRDEESQYLQTAVERYESEQQRLESDMDRVIGESRELQTALEQAQRELERAQAEIIEARAEGEQTQAELEQARAAREQAQAGLEQAHEEREQFEAMIKSREAGRQRMLAEHAIARMQAERALAETVARHERLEKQIETLARECAPPERQE